MTTIDFLSLTIRQIWLVKSTLRVLTYQRCRNLFSWLRIFSISWNIRNIKPNTTNFATSGMNDTLILYASFLYNIYVVMSVNVFLPRLQTYINHLQGKNQNATSYVTLFTVNRGEMWSKGILF